MREKKSVLGWVLTFAGEKKRDYLASAALAELGYTASEISAAMKGIPAQELPVEETVRRCLRAMVSQV